MEHGYARWDKNGKRYGNLYGRTRHRTPFIQAGEHGAGCPFKRWKAFSDPPASLKGPFYVLAEAILLSHAQSRPPSSQGEFRLSLFEFLFFKLQSLLFFVLLADLQVTLKGVVSVEPPEKLLGVRELPFFVRALHASTSRKRDGCRP